MYTEKLFSTFIVYFIAVTYILVDIIKCIQACTRVRIVL